MLDIVLYDDSAAKAADGTAPAERDAGFLVRDAVRLSAIGVACLGAVGAAALFVHYVLIEHILPDMDVPAVFKTGGALAATGVIVAAIGAVVIGLPGYVLRLAVLPGAPKAAYAAIVTLALATLIDLIAMPLTASRSPGWSVLAVLLFGPFAGLALARTAVGAIRVRYAAFACLLWAVGTAVFYLSMTQTASAPAAAWATHSWQIVLGAAALLLVNAAVALTWVGRGFALGAMLVLVTVTNPGLLFNAPFRIMHIGDFDPALRFHTDEKGKAARAALDQLCALETRGGLVTNVHVVDAIGTKLYFECPALTVPGRWHGAIPRDAVDVVVLSAPS